MTAATLVSVSGGKDSAATLGVALERHAPAIHAVFADTGNEHQHTYDTVDALEDWAGIPIRRVRADFTEKMRERREAISQKWPDDLVERALAVMQPTDNPFLDSCLLYGRFPSPRGRFCTGELKVRPIQAQVLEPLLEAYDRVETWVGVRADESPARAKMKGLEPELGDPDTGHGSWIRRPILAWSVRDVWAYHDRRGIPRNPLYAQGFTRVGCFPCIMARKPELSAIADRFPAEVDRLREWEALVNMASQRGNATFFMAIKHTPGAADITPERHGIDAAVAWARGGSLDQQKLNFPSSCSEGYCE